MLNYSQIVQKIQKVVSHYNKKLLWHRWKNVHACTLIFQKWNIVSGLLNIKAQRKVKKYTLLPATVISMITSVNLEEQR